MKGITVTRTLSLGWTYKLTFGSKTNENAQKPSNLLNGHGIFHGPKEFTLGIRIQSTINDVARLQHHFLTKP
jgi:hypothetical protein